MTVRDVILTITLMLGAGLASQIVADYLRAPRMLVLLFAGALLGLYPMVLLLTWAVCFYLTFIEARQQRLDAMRTLWWMLLVFFTHFLGYLALRGYAFYRRRAAV